MISNQCIRNIPNLSLGRKALQPVFQRHRTHSGRCTSVVLHVTPHVQVLAQEAEWGEVPWNEHVHVCVGGWGGTCTLRAPGSMISEMRGAWE